MPFDFRKIGSSIRALRSQRGLSQIELAKKAGLTQPAIALIEQGRRAVSLETLDSLAKGLNVPADCLTILGYRSIASDKDFTELLKSIQNLIRVAVEAQRPKTRKGAAKPARRVGGHLVPA